METLPNTELLVTRWEDPAPERPAPEPSALAYVRAAFRALGPLAPRLAAFIAFRLFTTPRFRARHASSDEMLASARRFDLKFRNRRLQGYEWGEGERTILLVHGWESRGTAMRSFVPPLLERGFRVVAFDGPAHGDSGGRRTNIIHFSEALRAVIRQLGPVYGIIGHSFGGASSLFALNRPGLAPGVEKLVLVAVPANMLQIFNEAVRMLGLPPAVAKHFKNLIEKKAGRGLSDLDDAILGLPEGRVNILLVHDRQDRQVSWENSLLMARRWTNARLLLTDGYGHYRLMKNPDLIRRVAEFFATPPINE